MDMKKKLLFVFNPCSGKAQIKNQLLDIVDTMVKADYEVTIYPTQCAGDAKEKVEAYAENYDLVVCSGGDGTLDEYNNMRIQDEFIYGMITNSTSVGGFKGMTGKDVLLDDGVFEVTLIKKPKNPMELNEIIASLINLVDDTDMIYSFKTAEVKFTASREIPWTLDGEFGGDHEEVCVKNLKQAVDIMVKKPEE